MVRSLLAVLVLVAILVGFNMAQQPDPVVRDIDYPAAVALANDKTAYAVLAPQPLPPGWRATSARTRPERGGTSWHLGLVTASGSYAAVEQTDGERRGFVGQFADGARPAGSVQINGLEWRRLEGGDPEPRALVRSAGGVTTVVAGTADWNALELLARATVR